MNNRIVDYMRLFWRQVQRKPLSWMKSKEKFITRTPGYFSVPRDQKWRVSRSPRSVSLCLYLVVKQLSLSLSPPCLFPWNLFSRWSQYTYDSQMSLAVHSAPSQTSTPGESTCAKLPPQTWSFTQYVFFFNWTPTKCWDEQGELIIPLCFYLYFQLRAWEPCFPWMFPRVLAFISPISSPKLYRYKVQSILPSNSGCTLSAHTLVWSHDSVSSVWLYRSLSWNLLLLCFCRAEMWTETRQWRGSERYSWLRVFSTWPFCCGPQNLRGM